MTAFEHKTWHLDTLVLRPLRPENVGPLSKALAAIPPWSVIGIAAERLAAALLADRPSIHRFEIEAGGELGGIVTVQDPFLYGPYLQLLAILPEFQDRKFGQRILEWMETEARSVEARQMWLCVSSFNERARKFYERYGFEAVSLIEKLANEGSDELLMRKRLPRC